MNSETFDISSAQREASQTVTFIENELPSLSAGTYNINVKQNTGGTGTGGAVEDSFDAAKKIYIGAERFKLNPEDVYSTYPPKSYSGNVANCLPNIVFSKPALPWMRTIGCQAEGEGMGPAPWLALLMFYNDDPTPEIKELSLADLDSQLPSDTFFPSKFLPEPGEMMTDRCQVIDVDVDVFNKIAPTASDLPYLSHIRQVDITSKAAKLDYDYHPQKGLTLKTIDPEQRFSVVISNRLPKPDTRCHMFLVSFENMGCYLPKADGGSNVPSVKKKVRLVVLENWEFYASQFQQSIADVVGNLNRVSNGIQGKAFSAPMTLRLPDVSQTNAGNISDDVKEINTAFSMGFVPLDHQTRLGGNTVSWQRGPFVPYEVQKVISFPEPVSSADHLIRYNPEKGMFDTTYASAWQLGRLLCIQNKGFAYEFYQWKQDKNKGIIDEVEQEVLLNSLSSSEMTTSSLVSEHLVKTVLSPMLEGFFMEGEREGGAKPEMRETRRQALKDTLTDPKRRAAIIGKDVDKDPSQLIVNWMSRLHLLYGVPYRYLVPHKNLLPVESIKLFYLDTNYVNALIDGAFSIGRSFGIDKVMDQEAHKILVPHINRKAGQLRRQMFGLPATSLSDKAGVFSGFFLNSQLVTDFPGLEVAAIDSTKTELPLLRMERISPEILLCIFDGAISSIQFTQPSEGLFFGFSGTYGNFYKKLRYQNASDRAEIGKINPDLKVNILPYRSRADHTLNIDALAQSIESALNGQQPAGTSGQFTAADFALQMTQAAEQITLE